LQATRVNKPRRERMLIRMMRPKIVAVVKIPDRPVKWIRFARMPKPSRLPRMNRSENRTISSLNT
jgi:hypothetical protein